MTTETADAEMTHPVIRECAEQLAREFHATAQRKRYMRSMDRHSWDLIPEWQRELMIRAVYSLVYRGIIICPQPAHRIGTHL